jgi:hypothetical protein
MIFQLSYFLLLKFSKKGQVFYFVIGFKNNILMILAIARWGVREYGI